MPGERSPNGEIFVFDGDDRVQVGLAATLKRHGYAVIGLNDVASLLKAAQRRPPACVLFEVSKRTGVDDLVKLNAETYPAPVLIMSGDGDITLVVATFKHGAVDFIEKPFSLNIVLGRVGVAIETWKKRNTPAAHSVRFPSLRTVLTQREIDILELILGGASSKQAALQLGISFRTVESHRSSIKAKLGAKNLPDLMRIIRHSEI